MVWRHTVPVGGIVLARAQIKQVVRHDMKRRLSCQLPAIAPIKTHYSCQDDNNEDPFR